MSEVLNDVLLSDKWIQIGTTFVPIPPDLYGFRQRIEEEAHQLGLYNVASPFVIDHTMVRVFANVRKALE